jgi:hypothetical protein
MTITRRAGLLLVATLASAFPSAAQTPVAIVEAVKGQVHGLEAMDYLVPGRTFHLSGDDAVVIDYLKSCVRETIRGGEVTIGTDESAVEQGVVERAKVECDAQDMMAASGQTLDATGFILRDGAGGTERLPTVPRAPAPQFTLYGSAPLIEVDGAGPLVIARLDVKGEYLKFDVDRDNLKDGRFLDFADAGQALSPGGVYAARWQKRLVVFRIDPAAKPGATPLLGRLLRLGFAP